VLFAAGPKPTAAPTQEVLGREPVAEVLRQSVQNAATSVSRCPQQMWFAVQRSARLLQGRCRSAIKPSQRAAWKAATHEKTQTILLQAKMKSGMYKVRIRSQPALALCF